MSASSGLVVQGRVVYALILREVHTLYGNTTLGYLWAVFQCFVSILIFWGIRYFMGVYTSHGISTMAFLLSGFLPWYIFSYTLSKSMTAVSGNLSLLTYAQVTSLDLIISRMIVVWATQVFSAVIIYVFANFIGQDIVITHWGYLFLSLFCAPLFGLAIGSLCCSFSYYWNPLERIVPFAMRLLFFVSGIFFSINSIPYPYKSYLLYNPVVHLIELTRKAVLPTSVNNHLDIVYLLTWLFVSLTLALLLERYLRGKITYV